MAKKIRCKSYSKDWVRVRGSSESTVALEIKLKNPDDLIFLSVESAKKLIKQLKKSLPEDDAEMPDNEDRSFDHEAESVWIPKVCEIVEIFQNTHGHQFEIGEKVRVIAIENDGSYAHIKAENLDGSDYWYVNRDIRPLTAQSS